MSDEFTDDKFLRVSEVARIFDVQSATIREWISSNKLEATKLPSGQFRIRQSEIRRFANLKHGAIK